MYQISLKIFGCTEVEIILAGRWGRNRGKVRGEKDFGISSFVKRIYDDKYSIKTNDDRNTLFSDMLEFKHTFNFSQATLIKLIHNRLLESEVISKTNDIGQRPEIYPISPFLANIWKKITVTFTVNSFHGKENFSLGMFLTSLAISRK